MDAWPTPIDYLYATGERTFEHCTSIYLAWDMSNKWRPVTHRCSKIETRSCSQSMYEGEVEQWVEEEVVREPPKMTGSLEQLAALEE